MNDKKQKPMRGVMESSIYHDRAESHYREAIRNMGDPSPAAQDRALAALEAASMVPTPVKGDPGYAAFKQRDEELAREMMEANNRAYAARHPELKRRKPEAAPKTDPTARQGHKEHAAKLGKDRQMNDETELLTTRPAMWADMVQHVSLAPICVAIVVMVGWSLRCNSLDTSTTESVAGETE